MTSATTPKTIELYGMGCQHEDVATAAITPGYLVERNATGVAPHSTAGENANASFAVEMEMTGGTIDTDYAIGDQVVFKTYAAGSGVYAVVAAGATAITKGAFLSSAGDGTLEVPGNHDIVVAQALEAVDNSGGAEEVRIKVEIVSPQRTASA